MAQPSSVETSILESLSAAEGDGGGSACDTAVPTGELGAVKRCDGREGKRM